MLLALALALPACGGDDDEDGASGETTETTQAITVDIPPPEEKPLEQAAEDAGCVLEDPEDEGNDHTEDLVRYRSNPPTSGDHNPIPAQDGIYEEAPPTEALVHSLEHGRIIIQYSPDADEETVAGLTALLEEDPYHMLLTPNETDMPYEVAATAWTHLLGCDEMNDQVYDAIRAFKEAYRDKGPEFVP